MGQGNARAGGRGTFDDTRPAVVARGGPVTTLLVAALIAVATAQTPPPPLRVVHKARGVTIHAVPEAPWCAFGAIRLEPVRLDLEPRRDGKTRRASARDEARLERFIARLGADLSTAFAPLETSARGGRVLSVVPKVRRVTHNKAWLNVLGLAAVQTPMTGSGAVLELEIRDRETQQVLAVMVLADKGFWARQIDLRRYRYAFSGLGQAHAHARGRAREAARQLERLLACHSGSVAAARQEMVAD